MIRRYSLLWPDINKRSFSSKGMKAPYIKDLGVEKLISLITDGTRDNHVFYQALSQLCTDRDVLNYRLDILDDFMNLKDIDNVIYYVLESIRNRKNDARSSYKQAVHIKIEELINNINEYLTAINTAYNMLQGIPFKSLGMNQLTAVLQETIETPFFKYFSLFGSDLRDANNRPEFLSFKMTMGLPMAFKEARLYDLFTLESFNKTIKSNNNGQVHQIRVNEFISEDLKDIFSNLRDNFYEKLYSYYNELDKNLSIIEYELHYYLTVSKLFKELKSLGINVCRPVFRSMDDKITFIKNGYDPLLTLQLKSMNKTALLVPNDVDFSNKSLSAVITGVNLGGKTTWLRMTGLAHVMAQAGLYVLADEAILSPVDNILTVFASEELGVPGFGKLGEDFIKINELFSSVTGYSLVLLNEALSSTSQDDAAFLISEYIKIMNEIGCRSAIVTHFIKVVNKIMENNQLSEEKTRVLLSKVEKVNNEMKRTYKIEEGFLTPDKLLTDLAEKEGIAYHQLVSAAASHKKLGTN